MGAVIAAAAMAAEERVVDRMRVENATAPDRAISLEDLRPLERRRRDRLVRAGIAHEVNGKYWLDERVYAEWARARRKLMVGMLVVVLVMLGILLMFYSMSPPRP